MALFESNEDEKVELKLWIENVNKHNDLITEYKCDEYNFDFFKCIPYEKAKRIDWEASDGCNEESREFSTKPSTRPSRLTYQDELEDIINIPDLPVNFPDSFQ